MILKIYRGSIFQHILGALYVFMPFLSGRGANVPGDQAVFILLYVSVFSCVLYLALTKVYRLRAMDCVFLLCQIVIGLNLLLVSTETACKDYITWMGLFLLYCTVRSIRIDRTFYYYLIGGGLLQAFYALYLHYYSFDPGMTLVTLCGSFSNPALFSFYLLVAFITLFGLLVERAKPRGFAVFGIMCLLFLGGLIIYSWSRAAWIALSMGGVFLLWKSVPSVRNVAKQVIKGKPFLSCFVLFLLICGGILLYLYKMDSANGRLFIWHVALGMIGQNPWFGSGTSSVPCQYMLKQADFFALHPDSVYSMLVGDTTHVFNEYLLILIEQGVMGLIAFFLLLYCYFRVKLKSGELIGRAVVISILIIAIFSYPFENFLFKFLFVLLLAVSAGRSRLVGREIGIPLFIRYGLIGLLVWVCVVGGEKHLLYTRANACLNNKNNMTDSVVVRETNLYLADLKHDSGYLSRLAEFYLCRGNDREALRVLKLLSRVRTSHDMYCEMGKCSLKLGLWEDAEKYFKKAYDMIPSRVTPLYHLLKLYKQTGKIDRAVEIANLILARKFKVINSVVLEARWESRQFLVEQSKWKGGEPRVEK